MLNNECRSDGVLEWCKIRDAGLDECGIRIADCGMKLMRIADFGPGEIEVKIISQGKIVALRDLEFSVNCQQQAFPVDIKQFAKQRDIVKIVILSNKL